MRKRISFCLISLTIFAGCYKNHLYVQQEWVDRNFLASTHIGTPDPRQENPPEGQRLLVAWRFPSGWIDRQLKLVATIRFWDQSEKIFVHPIEAKRSYAVFGVFEDKILTYRIEVFDFQDERIEVWEHHFWTPLIKTTGLMRDEPSAR